MKRLLDAIIAKWFCLHKWQVEHKQTTYWALEDGGGAKSVKITWLCEKCGRFKRSKM